DSRHLELLLEKRENVADDGVQIDVDALAALRAWPRQIQQAVDDLRRAERLTLDLLEQYGFRILRVRALEQHLREARDPGEGRGELVRHARSEQPDRRHLFGNLELFLEPHAVG